MSNKVEILKKIESYKMLHPELAELSEPQIISTMIDKGEINLTEDDKITIFNNNTQTDISTDLTLEKKSNTKI